jgi:hypothetical protein
MANYFKRWRQSFKGLSLDGGRADFSKKKKTLATLPFIKIYLMSLLLAGSISLDSTLKYNKMKKVRLMKKKKGPRCKTGKLEKTLK